MYQTLKVQIIFKTKAYLCDMIFINVFAFLRPCNDEIRDF